MSEGRGHGIGQRSDSGRVLWLLLDKVQSYLEQLNGDEFRSEFGKPSPERVRIIVNCVDEPDEEIRELVGRCRPWTADNNASISLAVGDG